MKMITNTMNEYIQVDTNKSMLDTYVAHFIAEIEKYKRPRPDGSIDWSKAKPNIIELIKVIGGKAYNRGVEDSLSKVPKEGNDSYYKNIYPPQSKWKEGFDDCRQQTIDNINKLITNK